MVRYIVNLSVPWLECTVDSLNEHLCKTDIYSWSLPFFPPFILTLYKTDISLRWTILLVPVLKVSVFERVKCTWQSVLFCLFLFHFVPHIKQEMTCFCFGNVKEYRCTLDCKQPLLFFRFSKGSARARVLSGKAARHQKPGLCHASPVSYLQSRMWSFVCLGRFVRRTKKEERLFVV